MEKLSWKEFKSKMVKHNVQSPKEEITGVIVFDSTAFDTEESLEGRSYRVSSYNKGFNKDMPGHSIFADCCDGYEKDVRVDNLVNENRIEYCYFD